MTNVRAMAALVAVAALVLTSCADEGSPSVGQTPSSQAPSALPTFQATQHTEIHADITARSAELKAAGADVALAKIDEETHVVVVAVRGDLAKATAVLHARYPREALRVESGDVGF